MEKIQVWSDGISAGDYRYAIISARFNAFIVEQMEEGALETFKEFGATSVQKTYVPGAFELPLAAKLLAESGMVDAILALGCVIRGETPHFEYVSDACVSGLNRVALDTGIPVVLGVLTTETVEQAQERASISADNKGRDAALTAMEMLQFKERIGTI